MTLRTKISFWLLAAAALLLFLFVFSSILLPFVAGMALAYLLDPLADWLEAHGMGRLAATVIILISAILSFILALVLVVPIMGNQLISFIERVPDYVSSLQSLLNSARDTVIGRFLEAQDGNVEQLLSGAISQGATWLASLLQSLLSGGQAIANFVSLFVVTPVVAFYLLYDWDKMIAEVDRWLPREHAVTIRGLISEMNVAMSGFIRGQFTVCMIMAIFYMIMMTVIGLNFGLLIGFVAGMLSFIPFIGSIAGFVVAGGVALVQFWNDPIWIAATIAVYVVGQVLEGNILQPKLVGASVGLHPVWLMFALFAFGSLFGFVGMLIAVPAAAVVAVLARFSLQQYLDSKFYHGYHEDENMLTDEQDPNPAARKSKS